MRRCTQVWYFPCNQWLDSRHADGATRRTLEATTSFSPDSLLMWYRVRAKTGDVRGAATDATPSINIFGSSGNTGPKRLNVPGASGKLPTFDRGSECEVTLSAFDVGDMTHVVIALDGTGLLSSWFLDELEVEHLGTGQLLRFEVGRCVSVEHKTTSCRCCFCCVVGPTQHSCSRTCKPTLDCRSSEAWQLFWLAPVQVAG